MRFFFVILFAVPLASAEDCVDWFKRSKIDPNSKDCLLECSVLLVDMGTFSCLQECAQLCAPSKNKCKLDPFWTTRLKGLTSPFSKLEGDDLLVVENALGKLPKDFRPSNLKSIVRGSSDGRIATGFSVATSSEEFIILFAPAFTNSEKISRIIAHEVVHFLIEKEWAAEFKEYEKVSGWNSKNSKYRPGNFVDSDGKFSSDEDFANNIEFYLFERDFLEKTSPDIFKWIDRKVGSKLKLQKGCQNES